MKRKLKLILISIAVLLCFAAKAQTTVAYSASHLQAAEKMLVASGLEQNLQRNFNAILSTQANLLPENQRAAFLKVMNVFLTKYVTWQDIKTVFIPLYAEKFSEDELNKIADFLMSPAGKKMTDSQAELMKKGGEWGQALFIKHQDELKTMMKDAFAEAPVKN